MTRQHFVAIADILGRERASLEVITAFVSLLRGTNSAFDSYRFLEAVEKARENAGWQSSYHVQNVRGVRIDI